MLDRTCIVYLDDILIYSEDEDEHDAHVLEVLERLLDWGLFYKASKCVFSTKAVEFLGFIVTLEGVVMDPSRVKTIDDWPTPKSYRDVQVFLGFANFYRRFIFNYSTVVKPMTDLLKAAMAPDPEGPQRKGGKKPKKGPTKWYLP